MEQSIASAISRGLKIGPIPDLRWFTESDPNLSFHEIPRYFDEIALTLRWQSTNIISEDFLSNRLCYFVLDRNYFCTDTGRFSYSMNRLEYNGLEIKSCVFSLPGPWMIETSDLNEQLKCRGFILWKTDSKMDYFLNGNVVRGTFRNFFPKTTVKMLEGDELLQCEYNTKKGVHYLKLLHKSYVKRLWSVFDLIPIVLLDIIGSYVLGELKN
ncbi:MAG: hypothetical protein Harvfovirus3_13 [Harvfovirus sp.]|uniref:Uncharacterized protein n=1 Tax=Harvfovirus sp. TaxID=2487768 RepID=A0A3G5A061_9VIRU|nr:MAG: hypothetical protein Harvfovirus3_13 [Harvfovirus sp.]